MVSQQPLILVNKLYLIIKFRIKAITFTGVLPSGQDNERGEEVDEEEVGEIEYSLIHAQPLKFSLFLTCYISKAYCYQQLSFLYI